MEKQITENTMKSQNKLKFKYNITSWADERVNFWGIPKSGNTSVKTALLREDTNKNNSSVINQEVHDINKILYIDKNTALTNGFKNFTLVRNPYERCISMYKDFVLKRPTHLIEGIDFDRTNMSFDKFLSEIIKVVEDTGDMHIRSQTSYLMQNNNIVVEHIFKIEEIYKLAQFLNLPITCINTSEGKLNLNQQQKNIIYDRYNNDFKYLGYQK